MKKKRKIVIAVAAIAAAALIAAIVLKILASRRKKKEDAVSVAPPPVAKKKTISAKALIISGCVLLAAAAGIQAYSMADDYLAGQRARKLLEQSRTVLADVAAEPSLSAVQPMPPRTPPDVGAPESRAPEEARVPDAILFSHDDDAEEPTVEAEPVEIVEEEAPVYDIAGVLSIPRYRLELPVINDCTPALLKVSVCRYSGNAGEWPRRLVVAGHNYRSHFGRIPALESGDNVYYTAAGGEKRHYTVTEIVNISMDDHVGLASGEWDITLFTCDKDRTRRILVRCSEVIQPSLRDICSGFEEYSMAVPAVILPS